MASALAHDPRSQRIIPFRPRETDADQTTVSDCFWRYKADELDARGRSPETIGEYQTHLRRWEDFWRDRREQSQDGGDAWKYRMGTPVLVEVRRAELLAFRNWLQGLGGLGNRTLDKHVGTICSILGWARKNGLIEHVPKLEPLPASRRARRLHLSYEEAEALKVACGVARWPAGLPHPPALYWEAAIVGYCCYGFRTQEQIRYERRMTALDWSGVHWEAATPHPDGKAEWPLGWLVYTPQKQEWAKPEELVLPLCAAYHRHLKALWQGETSGPVFPFPFSNDSYYAQWQEIVKAAGIRPKRSLDGAQPQYTVRHLRKTCTTWINNHRRGMAIYVTGHAEDRDPSGQLGDVDSRVSRDHYDFAEQRLIEALSTLPLPPSFERPLYTGRRQLTLF